MAVRIEIAIFLKSTPCNLVYGYHRIEGTYVRQRHPGVTYKKMMHLKWKDKRL